MYVLNIGLVRRETEGWCCETGNDQVVVMVSLAKIVSDSFVVCVCVLLCVLVFV